MMYGEVQSCRIYIEGRKKCDTSVQAHQKATEEELEDTTHLEFANDLGADFMPDIQADGLLCHDEVGAVVAHPTHHAPVARAQLGDLREVLGVQLVDVLLAAQKLLYPLSLTVVQLLVVQLPLSTNAEGKQTLVFE